MQVAVELRRFLRRQISFPGALGQRVHTFCVVCVKVNREQMPPSLACKRRPRMAASVLGVMTWELIGGSLPIMPDLRLNRKTAQIPTRNLAPTVSSH